MMETPISEVHHGVACAACESRCAAGRRISRQSREPSGPFVGHLNEKRRTEQKAGLRHERRVLGLLIRLDRHPRCTRVAKTESVDVTSPCHLITLGVVAEKWYSRASRGSAKGLHSHGIGVPGIDHQPREKSFNNLR